MHPIIALHVWSDYVCPFCYLELPVLENIRSEFGPAVDIHWRAFELRPDPAPTLDPSGEYLHSTWERAVYPMAAERGMLLRLPPVQPRSRMAFEAEMFARDHGLGPQMHTELFRAFFEQGADIGDADVLAGIARSTGLDGTDLRDALQAHRYTDAVIADRHEAERLGVSGVPAMLLEASGEPLRRQLLTGALPFETLRDAVANALST